MQKTQVTRIAAVLLSIVAATTAVQAQTSSSCPAIATSRNRGEGFKIAQPLTIALDEASEPCAAAIRDAASLWQNSMANSGFNVRFNITTDPVLYLRERNFIRVRRGPTRCGGAGCFTAVAETDPSFGPGLQRAEIDIDARHVTCESMAETFAHELGHGFLLNDVTTCKNALNCDSIMGPAVLDLSKNQYVDKAVPKTNGPSPCDETVVVTNVNPTLQASSSSCPFIVSVCPTGHRWDDASCSCVGTGLDNSDPVVIDTAGDGVEFTSIEDGVRFDFAGDGVSWQTAWTRPDSDDGWLALDRNRNGIIDNGLELFGDLTSQPPSTDPNGFAALAEFDRHALGGNADDAISAADAVFASLVVWHDRDQDGFSDAGELTPLADLGIVSIDLSYRFSARRDTHGNLIRYRTKVTDDRRDSRGGGWAYDVFLKRRR